MRTTVVRSPLQVRVLGTVGLAAITLLGWACEQQAGSASRARGLLAWLVTHGVTAMGWTIDHIAGNPAPHASMTAGSADRLPRRIV